MENTKNVREKNRIVKKFVITIEETASQNFEIEAENTEQAMAFAQEKYQNGEFVLKPGEVYFKQMAIMKPDGEATEWIEF